MGRASVCLAGRLCVAVSLGCEHVADIRDMSDNDVKLWRFSATHARGWADMIVAALADALSLNSAGLS